MRVRVQFSKTDAMRYTGHLDLHRAWERTFRRAGLPLAYTQGFSPHPRLNLAAALPLGFTSQHDLIDAWLEQELPASAVTAALEQAAPPGVRIEDVQVIDDRAPTLQTILLASEYHITLLEPLPEVEERLAELLASPSLPRQRRGKDYDLRPLILSAELLPPGADGHTCLLTQLSAREGATGRPEELVQALGGDPLATRVHRTRLIFSEAEEVV